MLSITQVIFSLQSDSSGSSFFCVSIVIVIIIAIVFVVSNHNRNIQQTKETIQSLGAIESIPVGKCITGFDNLDNNTDGFMNCAITGDDFVFLREIGTEIGRIPRNSINQIVVEDKSKITERITVGRVLALGIFALAAPKTEKIPSFYLLFDWDKEDGTKENTVFEFSSSEANIQSSKSASALRKYVKPKIDRLKLNEKKCPYCAEIIKKEANVCKFCGRDLPMN